MPENPARPERAGSETAARAAAAAGPAARGTAPQVPERWLVRLNDWLERAATAVVVLFMAGMVLIIFAQVLGRYALHYSIPWAEELARFLLIWLSMLAGAVATRRQMHVGFEGLLRRLPPPAGRAVRRAGGLIAIAVFAVTAWYGFQLAWFNRAQVSAAMGLSMSLPYFAVPVGSLLLVLFLIEGLFA